MTTVLYWVFLTNVLPVSKVPNGKIVRQIAKKGIFIDIIATSYYPLSNFHSVDRKGGESNPKHCKVLKLMESVVFSGTVPFYHFLLHKKKNTN